LSEPSPKNKNETKQDYGTDKRLLKALANKGFVIDFDLACTRENCVVNKYPVSNGFYYPEDDAFSYNWSDIETSEGGWLFLNPPFANIRPWAQKCWHQTITGSKIILLTPASVGSTWFQDFVFNKAHVFFLKGRLKFEGAKPNPNTGKVDPYPKDCMISVFDNFHTGFNIWDWGKDA